MDLKELRELLKPVAVSEPIRSEEVNREFDNIRRFHEESIALITRVEAVVKEMRDSCDMYQGHIGRALLSEPMKEPVTKWADRLEGKHPEEEWNPKEECWP